MQPRRHFPLILLSVILLILAGLFGLSFVFTPQAPQEAFEKELSVESLARPDGSIDAQPAEYP